MRYVYKISPEFIYLTEGPSTLASLQYIYIIHRSQATVYVSHLLLIRDPTLSPFSAHHVLGIGPTGEPALVTVARHLRDDMSDSRPE